MFKLAAFFLGVAVILSIVGNSWIPHLALAAYSFFMMFIFFFALGLVTSGISRLRMMIHDQRQYNEHHKHHHDQHHA